MDLSNQYTENGSLDRPYEPFCIFPRADTFQFTGLPAADYVTLHNMQAFPSVNTSNISQTSSSEGRSEATPSSEDEKLTKRKAGNPVPEENKDEAYRERRRKNNESARKSREQKRIKAANVEREIQRLQGEIARVEHSLMMAKKENQRYYEEYIKITKLLQITSANYAQ